MSSEVHGNQGCLFAVYGFGMLIVLEVFIPKAVPEAWRQGMLLALMGYCAVWIFRKARMSDLQDRETPVPELPERAHPRQTSESNRAIPGECPYSIIGVEPTASGAEIRKAYRALARLHHPDNFPAEEKDQASRMLARIHRAYEIIGDFDARFYYDMFLKSCWPGSPSIEEAHRYIKERRELAGDAVDGVDDDCEQAPQERSLGASPPDDASAGPVSPEAPGSALTAFLKGQRGAVPCEPTAGPAVCSACGEPYQVAPDRSGPIHCERCGEELN